MTDLDRLSLKLAAQDMSWKARIMQDAALKQNDSLREWAQSIHESIVALNVEVEKRSKE